MYSVGCFILGGFLIFDFIMFCRISIFQIIDLRWMICGNTYDVLDSLGNAQKEFIRFVKPNEVLLYCLFYEATIFRLPVMKILHPWHYNTSCEL